MDEIEHLKKIVQDQTRMLQEKNRLLSEMEYRLKQSIVTGSRKEDLARFQFRLSKDTIEGQASLLKTILGSVPSGLLVVDTKNRIISCNQAAREILEISGKEVLGKPCSSFLGESCEMHCLMEEALKTGEPKAGREIKVRTGKGREVALSLNIAPICNSAGALIGGVQIFSDITGTIDRVNLLQERHDNLICVLARIMEKKDHYILDHSERVRDLALRLAGEVGVSGSEDRQEISSASLLHDIGLLSVPNEILSARSSRSEKPFDIIRSHPMEGEWMLNDVTGFDGIKRIVRTHHERFDGSGYPDGLSGDKIPFASRLIGLVEAYDAMLYDEATERRPKEEIFEEIELNSGTQFDPDLAGVFLGKVVGDGV